MKRLPISSAPIFDDVSSEFFFHNEDTQRYLPLTLILNILEENDKNVSVYWNYFHFIHEKTLKNSSVLEFSS